jgi:hypothetical protein
VLKEAALTVLGLAIMHHYGTVVAKLKHIVGS